MIFLVKWIFWGFFIKIFFLVVGREMIFVVLFKFCEEFVDFFCVKGLLGVIFLKIKMIIEIFGNYYNCF